MDFGRTLKMLGSGALRKPTRMMTSGLSATMLNAMPSSAATALHPMSEIICDDDTGGRAVFYSPDAPTHARRNAAGTEKITMAQHIANCNNLVPCNILGHKSVANFAATRRNLLAEPRHNTVLLMIVANVVPRPPRTEMVKQ